jgi:hypothetical protein
VTGLIDLDPSYQTNKEVFPFGIGLGTTTSIFATPFSKFPEPKFHLSPLGPNIEICTRPVAFLALIVIRVAAPRLMFFIVLAMVVLPAGSDNFLFLITVIFAAE